MRLYALALLLVTSQPPSPTAQQEASAVIRMPSHGASATIIYTMQGHTYILSCAHAFEGKDRTVPVKLDIPASRPDPNARNAGITLLDVDYNLDLSLLELHTGPVEYVCPVAPRAHRPGSDLSSVGYDEMRMPAMRVPTHITSVSETFTL
jgi:hypothetical protein